MKPCETFKLVFGVIAIVCFVYRCYVLFSGNLTEILLSDANRCRNVPSSVKMPTSLMVGDCWHGRFNKDSCWLGEIKATFPGAVILDKAMIKLSQDGIRMVVSDACQAGFTCPDTEGKREQTLSWKADIKLRTLESYSFRLLIDDAENRPIYCVDFDKYIEL